MDKSNARLTVYFEGYFWIGIFERISDGKLSHLGQTQTLLEPLDEAARVTLQTAKEVYDVNSNHI